MAEFCLECWNKLMGTEDSSKKYVMSKDLDLCEECGQWKRVIVVMKRRYIFKMWIEDWIAALRERKSLNGDK